MVAAATLLMAAIPGIATADDDTNASAPEGAAMAAQSSIPGLYGVSELVTGLATPTGMDIDPDTGYLWYTDFGADAVVAIDHAGAEIVRIDVSGSGTGQVDGPVAVVVADGEVFVAELLNDRIQVFDTQGNHLRYAATGGSGAGQVDGPCGLAVVGNSLYVADDINYRIQVLNKSNGSYVDQFGSQGSGDGQFELACNGNQLTHHNGELFIVDGANARVVVFDTAGNWERNFGSGTVSNPVAIDADENGIIWVVDYASDNVTLWTTVGAMVDSFGAEGDILGTLNAPRGIVVDPSGRSVWVSESVNDRIQPFTTLLCQGVTLTHVGTSYDDTFSTGSGDDVVRMGDGRDTVDGEGGDDLLCGGRGRDTIRGGPGQDTIRGGKAGDRLRGNGKADIIDGGSGADRIWSGAGPDTVYGDTGNDTLRGQRGRDLLVGQAGADTLRGGSASDTLRGNRHADDLAGGKGDDTLNGGKGNDLCKGAAGTDTAKRCETVFGVP